MSPEVTSAPRCGRDGLWTCLVAGLVAAGAALLTVPLVLDHPRLSPDVANYLGVANAFAHGGGFVEPIQWHYYLPGAPPQPAWAFLSPVISLVLALPIWLGAGTTGATLFHAIVASLIGGLAVVVGRRFMSLPAAAAAAVGLCWSPRWATVSCAALTEPYAVLGMLLIIAAAPLVSRSNKGALLCAAATIFGWLCRANVPLLAVAVVVAVLWQRRPLQALRHRPIWTYVAAVAAGLLGLGWSYQRATGLRPYANYDAFFEMFHSWELVRTDKKYVGTRAFMDAHWDAVVARWQETATKVVDQLFGPELHQVGWLLPVVVTWGIFGVSRDPATDLQRRVCALGALGFLLTTILTYGGFESRYLLVGGCCAWLAAASSLDQMVGWFAPSRRVLRLMPLMATLAVFVGQTLPVRVPVVVGSWRAYQARGTVVNFRNSAGLSGLCRFMDPADVAVATEAEGLHFLCGNPTFRLPWDIADRGVLDRFIQERGPRYFVVEKALAKRLRTPPRLVLLVKNSRYTLYEVVGFRGQARWHPPPSLACMGGVRRGCPP